MRTSENISMPFMKSLTNCLDKMIVNGYTEHFQATKRGLERLETKRVYKSGEIKDINFFKFEGRSNPDDNAIMYIIETNDGVKGTLIDDYGAKSDPNVKKFMKDVALIKKKMGRP